MKYTTLIGMLLIGIGLVSSYMGKIDFTDMLKARFFYLGVFYGGGFGMLLGGLLGWLYKKNVKEVKVVDSNEEPKADDWS